MLFVQSRRRDGRSYSPSLFESSHVVVVDFCSLMYNETDVLELVWLFCW